MKQADRERLGTAARGEFPHAREFRGIQQFTPISRLHPGFVHILHVGRSEPAGCFYYIMELGDDEIQEPGERLWCVLLPDDPDSHRAELRVELATVDALLDQL